jgi:hypothetical protein
MPFQARGLTPRTSHRLGVFVSTLTCNSFTDMLEKLDFLPGSASLYVIVRPEGLVSTCQLLVQMVPEEGPVVLRPSTPTEVPGATEQLQSALYLLNEYGAEDLCLVYSPVDVIVPDGYDQLQYVEDGCVMLAPVAVTDTKRGDVLHTTQIHHPASHVLRERAFGPTSRGTHITDASGAHTDLG